MRALRPAANPVGSNEPGHRFGIDLRCGLLEEGGRGVILALFELAYLVVLEAPLFIIVMQRLISGPYVNPDPLGTPVAHATCSRPVDKSLANPFSGVAVPDDKPGEIDGAYQLLLWGPQPPVPLVVARDGRDRGVVVVFYQPRSASLQVTKHPGVACGRVGPRLGPLVCALAGQPRARSVDEVVDDRFHVVRGGA